MLSLRMGTALVGRYVLIGPIGYGGMSIVYQAVDTVRGSRTAIKLLSPAFADDPYVRERVRQEALITNRLRHPSVPKVYDYGDAVLPDGRTVPYVAMELLTGTILAGRLAAGALPWLEAVEVAATIADVLAIAHRRGVVHRDLTPENIMMTHSGPKIIDFGEATTVEATSVLAQNQPVPSRHVNSGPLPSDDVYALGVLLYQMLTGHSPYLTSSAGAQLHAARLRHIAPTPVLLVPGLPRAVAEVCRGCMTKRQEDRPEAAQVALALWALLIDPAAEQLSLRGPQPAPATRPALVQFRPQPPRPQPLRPQPSRAQPPQAQPPQAQPPRAQPPQAQPPRAQPPRAQPPRAQPPQAQPPRALAVPGSHRRSLRHVVAAVVPPAPYSTEFG